MTLGLLLMFSNPVKAQQRGIPDEHRSPAHLPAGSLSRQ